MPVAYLQPGSGSWACGRIGRIRRSWASRMRFWRGTTGR